MKRERFGGGLLYTPSSLPAEPVARATKLAVAARRLRERAPDADVVVGGSTLLVLGSTESPSFEDHQEVAGPARVHTVDVVYDGPDLANVAAASGLTEREVIERHVRGRYVALLTGFMPGFAYLGGLDEALVLPRRAEPRARVPAGAVAIAGAWSGIYPFASPGGWNLLGSAVEPDLFDPDRSQPQRIAVLDEVQFAPAAGPSPAPRPRHERETSPERTGSTSFVVETASCIATVQDEGRFGQRGQGIPYSGPLDLETFRAANRAVGNPTSAAGVEVAVGKLTVRFERPARVSIDGTRTRDVSAGDVVVVDPRPNVVAYLAVRGGIDVPIVLGSRSTLLLASLGGFGGRRIARGDRLPVGEPSGDDPPAVAELPARSTRLGIVRGPADERLPPGAFEALLKKPFEVSATSDRVGVRLTGNLIPRVGSDRSLPEPVLPGAVQVTSNGTPIVLGPDAAVTGGYPLIGYLDAGSRARLGRLPPGSSVAFFEVDEPSADLGASNA